MVTNLNTHFVGVYFFGPLKTIKSLKNSGLFCLLTFFGNSGCHNSQPPIALYQLDDAVRFA